MRTRYGPGVRIPTTDGAEIEALGGSNPSFAAWEQNGPYTIALLIRGRSGGAWTKHLYRSGTSSTGDPRFYQLAIPAPRRTCVTRPAVAARVTITSVPVALVNDTTWSTLVGAWRAGTPRSVRGDGFFARLQYRGGDQHQRLVRHLPLGLGLLDGAGLQRRRRAHRASRLALDHRHGAALRTPIRAASCRPSDEAPALMGSAPPATPPRPAPARSLPDGIVVGVGALVLSKLSRDRLQGAHSRPCSNERERQPFYPQFSGNLRAFRESSGSWHAAAVAAGGG